MPSRRPGAEGDADAEGEAGGAGNAGDASPPPQGAPRGHRVIVFDHCAAEQELTLTLTLTPTPTLTLTLNLTLTRRASVLATPVRATTTPYATEGSNPGLAD